MKIVQGNRPDQWRCVLDDDMLCGLITAIDRKPLLGANSAFAPPTYRVEMFMRIDATCSTEVEAMAFARGCEAMVAAFGLSLSGGTTTIPAAAWMKGSPMQGSDVQIKRGPARSTIKQGPARRDRDKLWRSDED